MAAATVKAVAAATVNLDGGATLEATKAAGSDTVQSKRGRWLQLRQ